METEGTLTNINKEDVNRLGKLANARHISLDFDELCYVAEGLLVIFREFLNEGTNDGQ